MTDKLIVYMVTQERMGSPEAVVIYFAPIKYHLQKALPISYSQSQSLCLVTQREGVVRDKTKRLHGPGDQFPTSQAYLRAQPVIVPPHKGVKEAQRNNTKSCCTGLTCRHNDTKS